MPKKSMLELARECWGRVLAPDEPPKSVAEMIRLLCESMGVPDDGSCSTTLAEKLACLAEQAGVSLDKPDSSGASHKPIHPVYVPGIAQHAVCEEVDSTSTMKGELSGPTKRRHVDEVDKRTLNHNGGTKSRKVHTIGEKAQVIAAYDAIVSKQGGLGKGAKGKVEKEYYLGQGMLGRWLSNREEIEAAACEERKKSRRCISSKTLHESPKKMPTQLETSKTTDVTEAEELVW